MARSSYQKLKPLYVMDYLMKNSDADHPITTAQIIDYLNSTIGISVRVGMEYDPSEGEEDSEGIESFVVYGEDETDPNEFLESNCNIGFTGMVAMFAKRKGLSAEEIEKLECFIDESEFVFWD